MTPRLPALLVTVMILVALAPPAHARWRPWQQMSGPGSTYQLAEREGDIGADTAAKTVRKATGGRVLGVSKGKRGTYRVKVLLPGGRVRTVPVDSRTGQLLD